jgi:type IV pilus assembly protein PilA
MLRNRKGFTLIELLIVVVIIGILAAIALPKFGATRERAYQSAMESDLRNLQTAQEMYYSTGGYLYKQSGTITQTSPDTDLDFAASSGVTITLNAGSPAMGAGEGFGANAVHAATAVECNLSVGGTAAQGITCA